MYRIKDYLNYKKDDFIFLNKRRERIIEDFLHSNISDYLEESCFYYSSGSDATPIIGCLDITNKFIYCDIQESSNFNDSLYKLKSRIREHNNIEICYSTIEPEWFGLYNDSYKGNYNFRYEYEIKNFKAEFSLWKSENKYFILIYIDFDNNVIWKNIYLKYKIAPKIICNWAYEGGVDFKSNPLSGNMMPEYWLGYGNHVEGFELEKEITYFGDYGGGFVELYKNRNIKKIKQQLT